MNSEFLASHLRVREQRARALAPHEPDTRYIEHRFCECGVCGAIEWSSSSYAQDGEEAPDEPTLKFGQLGLDRACRSCAVALARSPELARWVVSVVRHTLFVKEQESLDSLSR